MKKLVSAILIACVTLLTTYTGTANAMIGNDLESVKALQNGDQTIEGVTIGQSLKDVFREKGKGIHTQQAYGHDHYYEYHTKKGHMIVTTNGQSEQSKVKRISMSYQALNGPSYEDVKKEVSQKAITRAHYNSVTGNNGYVVDGKVAYQFASKNPKDHHLKLYRIDLEA